MTDATKLTPIVCKADVFDEGVGCVLGVIENHSVRPLTRDELEQLIARLGEAEKQIAALTAEVELLRKVKITVATPNEVCDGDVTGTIEEIRRQYGDEALGWTRDWGDRHRTRARMG